MTSYPYLYKLDSKGKLRIYFIEREEADYRMVTGLFDGKLTRSKWTTAKPKNIDRSNATTAEEQAKSEVTSRYTKKSDSGYFDSIEKAKANPEGKFFQVMLATEVEKVGDDVKKKYPLIADPKLDGMRMTQTINEAISRKGKPIPTVPHIIESLELFHAIYDGCRLDGEIYNHDFREDFNALMSIARKQKPTSVELAASEEKLEYHVYDIFVESDPLMTALDRKEYLDDVASEYPYVEVVDWELVHNDAELELVKQKHLLAGYEGTILRSPNEPYHQKRTKHLMKVKEFITEEYPGVSGTLDCVVSGKGNKSDIAGAINVLVDGKFVSCGIRGSWKYCEELLRNQASYQGAKVTVRHFGKTPDGSLRFPVCIDINRPD